MDNEMKVITLAVVIVLVALFGALFYDAYQKGECHSQAFSHGYSAGDIAAVCQ